MSEGTLRQILLITDGHSNEGEDPVAVAALAHEQSIIVNVIGIVDENHLHEQGMQEIENISSAGGGVSQIVYAKQLAKTVQMVTRKAMTQTIHGVINKELSQILGKSQELEDLPPDKRGEVMEVVDDYSEKVKLEVLILVDTSASMRDKLPMVQEALTDLSVSLTSRIGENQFALYSFPGKRKAVERLMDWTPRLGALTGIFHKLSSGGVTPTGPALKEVMNYFKRGRTRRSLMESDREQQLFEGSGN
ncbi:VWA domain-containing protein [Alkalihalobacillus pseudalcaliphilus]|uniref:VWA domain-containing protein n=1 Tax=Alkalihalobacillus pseudalcaliphilus TaxID=79884 RepID=UPI00064E1443|nr:VWA domain-containing protein [Alkalihalobacillus pseudalcaliphilus]KMK74502.1 hypothetical protein AB990_20460 [Alkalihalobacillus pseudalcaliphilus]